jgi:uncharacterized protein with FMN-binding domain
MNASLISRAKPGAKFSLTNALIIASIIASIIAVTGTLRARHGVTAQSHRSGFPCSVCIFVTAAKNCEDSVSQFLQKTFNCKLQLQSKISRSREANLDCMSHWEIRRTTGSAVRYCPDQSTE